MKKLFPTLILVLFLISGFVLRTVGIAKGLSYWNDEDQVALMARAVLQHGLPLTPTGHLNGLYQIMLYYITALFFLLFGVNEIAGRLPSVLIGTVLIGVIYIVTKKIFGYKEALIASGLVTFSQMQLAWSTQLRPYIWMVLFTVLITYFMYLYIQEKKSFTKNLFIAFVLAFVSYLFHAIGLINILLTLLVIAYKMIIQKKYKYLFALAPIAVILIVLLRLTFSHNILSMLFTFDFNTLHYRVFLLKNYWWLLAGAFFGGLFLWRKKTHTVVLMGGFIFTIFAVAIFKINSQYVRYSLPAFPLLYIMFAVGMTGIQEKILKLVFKTHNKKTPVNFALLAVVLLLFLSFPVYKHKILFKPLYYYTINADMRENPIVDYKTAFSKIKKMIGTKKDVIVMDAWNDRVPYYLPGQKYAMIRNGRTGIDDIYGEKILGSTKEFEEQKARYKSGIVIVENWESLTAVETQNHIKNTLKHEFDINNLPYNEDDKWSISIYSWGL
jgi:4-amino-4-deoxy-L-arabinose transferase-like glycosyltransferase